MLLPREHGAWGLLLQPFAFAAILARRWEWPMLAALGLVLAGFVMREPLIVLARQRWVWRERKPESATAWRCLAWEVPLAAVLWVVLASRVPILPLAALTGVALGVTMLAVWLTVRNQQRSIALQLISSAGLSTTCLLAALVALGRIPDWAWWLWALLTAHAAGAILVVRARLEARAGSGSSVRRKALWYQAITAGAALAVAVSDRPMAAAALAFSVLVCLWELARLRKPEALTEPLKQVGWRTLGASLIQGALAAAAL
jgi:hypothetical protein